MTSRGSNLRKVPNEETERLCLHSISGKNEDVNEVLCLHLHRLFSYFPDQRPNPQTTMGNQFGIPGLGSEPVRGRRDVNE